MWNYARPCPAKFRARLNHGMPMKIGWQPYVTVAAGVRQIEELIDLAQWTGMVYDLAEVGTEGLGWQITLWGCTFSIRNELVAPILRCQICDATAAVYLQWKGKSCSTCLNCESGVLDSLKSHKRIYTRIAA